MPTAGATGRRHNRRLTALYRRRIAFGNDKATRRIHAGTRLPLSRRST
jgi:hypothetical protein